MLEKEVWQAFRAVWPWYAEREEPGIGAGMPDVTVMGPIGIIGRVELKRPDKVELRPSQWTWHEKWQRCHGLSVLITCRNKNEWQVYRIMAKQRRLSLVSNSEWVSSHTMLIHTCNLLRLE